MAESGWDPMKQTVHPGSRTGTVSIPASKSQAHRLLICAALGQAPAEIRCRGISKDIAATIGCLNALGAEIAVSGDCITVKPITAVPEGLCHLPCGESGSTLRFLLPVAGALGAEAVFHMEGRLPQRPLHPLDEVLTAHGMTIRQEDALLYVSGRLQPGDFALPGNVSSQYISGLLMALPLLNSGSTLAVTGELESAAYVTMTEDTLRRGGIALRKSGASWHISGGQRCRFPAQLSAEGDWSNAAFWFAAAFLGHRVDVEGLNPRSVQGDRVIGEQLARLTQPGPAELDVSQCPDLVPPLAAMAALRAGETTAIVNAARLRIKESDRLASVTQVLNALGAGVEEHADHLVLRGRERLAGGVTVSGHNDHRIAMMAAIAATRCQGPVTITGAECVNKSYPRFWADYEALGGQIART